MKKAILGGCLLFLATAAAHAINFTGRYETNWGMLELRQDGNKVTGSYVVPAPGEIEGVVESGTLTYRWLQSNGIWGMGRFKLLENGKKIEGPWGHGKSFDSGGIWQGQRQKPATD